MIAPLREEMATDQVPRPIEDLNDLLTKPEHRPPKINRRPNMLFLDEDVWAWAVIGAIFLSRSVTLWLPVIAYGW